MHAAINSSMGFRDWLNLLSLSVLWGGSFFFIELVIDDLPPLTIVLARVALAALALWCFALLLGLRPPRQWAVWRALFIMGAINNLLPFTLIVWGQTHIASGLAAILNATAPLFTVIVAGCLLSDEKITRAKLFGVALGFAGVVSMVGPQALAGLSSNLLAQLAILGAALSYAFAGVYGRRFKGMQLNPVVVAAGQVTASSLMLAPLALYFEPPASWSLPGAGGIAAIIGLGLLSTALAYILYFRLLASAGATNLLLVAFLIPVSAILLGVSVLGESLDARQIAGMVLIGCGLVAIDGRLYRGRRRRAVTGN